MGGLYLEGKSGKNIYIFFLKLGKNCYQGVGTLERSNKNRKKIIVTMKKKHFGAVSDFICIYMELHLLF